MSLRVTIEGQGSVEIAKECVKKVIYKTDIPLDSNCYRKVTVEIIQAGIVERKYYFPNAFVVNYNEDFGDSDGVGTFSLVVKQKKDKMAGITIEGGYPA